MALSVGCRLGPYEISGPLGAGGMGEVYRARDTRLGREVALKVLPAEVAGDLSRRQRFEQEARALAALNHPNIVAIHDVGTEGAVFFIVSELLDGEPLSGRKFSLRKTLDIAAQIAGGLAAAHDAGITHRDLKPDNILLTRDGRVKILDFGLAKVGGSPSQAAAATQTLSFRTEPGVVMGTVGYMSPEQVRGAAADHRSDIFNLGLILHELLAGQRTFHGDTSVEVMAAILKHDAPELPESVPGGVRQVVAHCLEKDPAHRFQSARDLGFALSAMTQTGSHSGAAALPPPRPSWRRRGLLALAAAGLMSAGAVGAMWWWRAPASPAWTGILLGGPEVPLFPRPAPDGHMIAFIAMIDNIQQVGVMKPESGNRVMLTHATDKGFTSTLAWSPDGAKIYYDRWTDVPRGIYSVPVLGGEEQLVLEDAGLADTLPDGGLLVSRYNSERQLQLFRFWPETGRLQGFPLDLLSFWSSARSFPDGREAVATATLIGPGREAGQHLYVVDLVSGKVRRLVPGSGDKTLFGSAAVTRDGKSVLFAVSAGNLARVTAVARDGHPLAPALLTLTSAVFSLDSGPDGSIYLDQVERPVDLLRFPARGGHVEKIATLPAYEAPGSPGAGAESSESFAVLPDGRAVFTQGTGGRLHLMVVEPGKEPGELINTSEATSAPVTAAGPNQIAFLIGPEPRRTIAVAAVSNGRISRRIPFDKGPIGSLASSPDGKTLYAAAGGNIWSIPAAGGDARKIRSGDYVAADPAGQYLLVQLTETPIIRLIRVPLNGGPEQEIPRPGPLRPAYVIGPNAIGTDGRILMPLGSSTWYWPPGLLEPSTGRFTRIPVDYNADTHAIGWTPDGQVMALGLGWRSKIWKFQPAAAGR